MRQERTHKTWTAVAKGVALVVLIFAAIATGMVKTGSTSSKKQADTLSAQRFVLVDKEGRMLAELGASPTGGAGTSWGLAIYHKNGQPAILLTVDDSGGQGLAFVDRKGNVRVQLASAEVAGRKVFLQTFNDSQGAVTYSIPPGALE